MATEPSLNCLHCNRLFVPDCRHRRTQRFCPQPACKRASHAASQRQWLAQPAQQDWWHGPENVQRVREWRAAHPGYWKRWKRKPAVALQETIKTPQTAAVKQDDAIPAAACATRGVPALLLAQSPVVVGLIAQMYGGDAGDALQETIAEVTALLFAKGRAVLGPQTTQPHENRKTHPLPPPAAAHAAKL